MTVEIQLVTTAKPLVAWATSSSGIKHAEKGGCGFDQFMLSPTKDDLSDSEMSEDRTVIGQGLEVPPLPQPPHQAEAVESPSTEGESSGYAWSMLPRHPACSATQPDPSDPQSGIQADDPDTDAGLTDHSEVSLASDSENVTPSPIHGSEIPGPKVATNGLRREIVAKSEGVPISEPKPMTTSAPKQGPTNPDGFALLSREQDHSSAVPTLAIEVSMLAAAVGPDTLAALASKTIPPLSAFPETATSQLTYRAEDESVAEVRPPNTATELIFAVGAETTTATDPVRPTLPASGADPKVAMPPSDRNPLSGTALNSSPASQPVRLAGQRTQVSRMHDDAVSIANLTMRFDTTSDPSANIGSPTVREQRPGRATEGAHVNHKLATDHDGNLSEFTLQDAASALDPSEAVGPVTRLSAGFVPDNTGSLAYNGSRLFELAASKVPAQQSPPQPPLAGMAQPATDSGALNPAMPDLINPLSLFIPPIAAASFSAAPGGTAGVIVAVTPLHALAPMIVDLTRSGDAGQVDLRLSPHELGRVTIHIVPDGDTLRITLQIERPETLDLLRRNTDQFNAELRQAGFASTSFSFSAWGNAPPPRRAQTAEATPLNEPECSLILASLPQVPIRKITAVGLDLRL